MRRWLAMMGLGWGLACAGPGSPTPGAGAEAPLLAFRPVDGGKACEWNRWSAKTGGEVVGRTPACPTQVVFKPDGSKVIYTTADGPTAHVSAWPGLKDTVSIPFPAFPEGVMDWEPLWVGADGVLRLEGLATPKETPKGGGEIALTAGDLATSVWKEGDELPRWEVKGGKAVRPAPDTPSPMVPWGILTIEASYEANRKGEGWTLLSALPHAVDPEAGFRSAARDGAWPSLASSYAACNSGQSCEKEAWNDRSELKALLGPEVSVGFLPAGSGGWLFGLSLGDTWHATAPVFWCADPDCKRPLPLAELPEADSLSIQPKGDYVLIGEERTVARPRVYQAGTAQPVFVLDEAARAGWLPDL